LAGTSVHTSANGNGRVAVELLVLLLLLLLLLLNCTTFCCCIAAAATTTAAAAAAAQMLTTLVCLFTECEGGITQVLMTSCTDVTNAGLAAWQPRVCAATAFWQEPTTETLLRSHLH
jgi:hypothetical protein